jgi:hypothetical protein
MQTRPIAHGPHRWFACKKPKLNPKSPRLMPDPEGETIFGGSRRSGPVGLSLGDFFRDLLFPTSFGRSISEFSAIPVRQGRLYFLPALPPGAVESLGPFDRGPLASDARISPKFRKLFFGSPPTEVPRKKRREIQGGG